MASASSSRAASAAVVLLLCLGAAGGDRDEFVERGVLSPGLGDKGLVTTPPACNVVSPAAPGVEYIRSALACLLKQYMMDSWAGSEKLAHQLEGVRRSELMLTPQGIRSTVQEELLTFLSLGTYRTSGWKNVSSTRAAGQKAWLTKDERFRLEPLLEDEYTFWKKNGKAIMDHWGKTSTLVRYYAIVSEGPDETSQKWVLMREVNQTRRKYVLTGQDRAGADAEEDGDPWPQYLYFAAAPEEGPPKPEDAGWFAGFAGGFFATKQAPTTTPPPRQSHYRSFFAAVQKDVELLEKLQVSDYSLVVRIAPASADNKRAGQGVYDDPWKVKQKTGDTLKAWRKFPEFSGAGSVFKTMHWPLADTFRISNGTAYEVSVEIVDYLRGGAQEKTAAERLLSRLRRKFRPFTFKRDKKCQANKRPGAQYHCCISNPKAVEGDLAEEEFEELARQDPEACSSGGPGRICAGSIFQ